MTIRIGILSLDADFEGSTASYYEPASWLSSMGIPSDVDGMSSGTGEFSLNATNDICVRIDATNGDILRTGVRPADEVGELDGTVLELPYVVMPLEESLAFADLTSGLPVPMTVNGATLSSLTVGRSGQNFRVTGNVSYNTGFLGTLSGSLTYEFRLLPVTHPTSESLLSVDTVDVDVNINGLAGWFVNGLLNLIINMFEGAIGDALEDVIKDQIDIAIQDQLDDAGDVPDNIHVTVQDITLSATDATLNALVAVPARSIDCPFEVANGSVKIRRRDQLRKLRRMRSQVLKGNPRGEMYIALMRRHGPELARILRRNRSLLKDFDALVAAGLEHFDEENPGEGKLGKRTANRARTLAGKVQEEASPALRIAIQNTLPDLEDFTSKPVRRVLDESAAELAKVAKPGRPARR